MAKPHGFLKPMGLLFIMVLDLNLMQFDNELFPPNLTDFENPPGLFNHPAPVL
jgi:hypothetical protein